jgi:hypothetical protein
MANGDKRKLPRREQYLLEKKTFEAIERIRQACRDIADLYDPEIATYILEGAVSAGLEAGGFWEAHRQRQWVREGFWKSDEITLRPQFKFSPKMEARLENLRKVDPDGVRSIITHGERLIRVGQPPPGAEYDEVIIGEHRFERGDDGRWFESTWLVRPPPPSSSPNHDLRAPPGGSGDGLDLT